MQSKISGPPQFTVSHSKGLKNTYKKGNILEAKFSRIIHNQKIPILVSSKLLRNYQCGQVDLCTYDHSVLTVYEIKTCPEGLNNNQIRRLNRSLELLTQVFGACGRLELLNHLPKD